MKIRPKYYNYDHKKTDMYTSSLKRLTKSGGAIENDKVHFFWEDHKKLRSLPQGFDIYLVNVKTMSKIAQIFVAFSEKLNFM